ncbi:hypothetical protein NDU88_004883 [Pleurodeles waltl]|uniref:Uncharacterized protein n=1 Tax=Pleurodeles waltl TaxID=8319 RepID=A0AAV7WB15_PLEWA|nr:hypothetical protein NDU88_004883 [Pleurodeles waltl]
MSERLDKHTEHLDQMEMRVSAAEDGQTALASGQLKVNTELDILNHKMDDLESRSRRNILRIMGLAESTSITNMEKFVENLLIQLLAVEFEGVEVDPGGRYVVAKCKGRALTFILIGIYGPNYDDPLFYRDLAAQVKKWRDVPQLWCGDFNFILSPALDRSGVEPGAQLLRLVQYLT